MSAAEARASASLAEEFLHAAEISLAAGLANPAVSCAVLAGVHANDAVCIVRLGRYSRARDHGEALALARSAGPDGRTAAGLLGKLLQEKTKAQYDTARISGRNAEACLQRARSLVTLASRLTGPE